MENLSALSTQPLDVIGTKEELEALKFGEGYMKTDGLAAKLMTKVVAEASAEVKPLSEEEVKMLVEETARLKALSEAAAKAKLLFEAADAALWAEVEHKKAKTSVLWDIENCQVPKGTDPYTIAKNIRSALANLGYRGPVSICAYGDTSRIPFAIQQALFSTGITLNHVPPGVKDGSDKKILVDMLLNDNRPPANYLLISGDRDFSNALLQLSMRTYNILLARPNDASTALVAAAKTVWLWTDLVNGSPPQSPPDLSRLPPINPNHNRDKQLNHTTLTSLPNHHTFATSTDFELEGKYIKKANSLPTIASPSGTKPGSKNAHNSMPIRKALKQLVQYDGRHERSHSHGGYYQHNRDHYKKRHRQDDHHPANKRTEHEQRRNTEHESRPEKNRGDSDDGRKHRS